MLGVNLGLLLYGEVSVMFRSVLTTYLVQLPSNLLFVVVVILQNNIHLISPTLHTCHKLWTEICEIRQIFK